MDEFSTGKMDASEQFYIEQYAWKYNDPGYEGRSEVYKRILWELYEEMLWRSQRIICEDSRFTTAIWSFCYEPFYGIIIKKK